jgi:hypothetical protein
MFEDKCHFVEAWGTSHYTHESISYLLKTIKMAMVITSVFIVFHGAYFMSSCQCGISDCSDMIGTCCCHSCLHPQYHC